MTKELYFTNHGRDWLGDEVPNDTLHHAPRPACTSATRTATRAMRSTPTSARGRSCSEFARHSSSSGRTWPPWGCGSTPAACSPRVPEPDDHRPAGSWNRTQKSGFRLMQVELKLGQPPKYEVFAEGWLQGDEFWGRPAYVHMPDGALLVSGDYNGAIYRITHQR